MTKPKAAEPLGAILGVYAQPIVEGRPEWRDAPLLEITTEDELRAVLGGRPPVPALPPGRYRIMVKREGAAKNQPAGFIVIEGPAKSSEAQPATARPVTSAEAFDQVLAGKLSMLGAVDRLQSVGIQALGTLYEKLAARDPYQDLTRALEFADRIRGRLGDDDDDDEGDDVEVLPAEGPAPAGGLETITLGAILRGEVGALDLAKLASESPEVHGLVASLVEKLGASKRDDSENTEK